MTREGPSEEVTVTLMPQHEKEPAVRTFEEIAFQAEGIASAETGPSWGSEKWYKDPYAGGVECE